MPPRAALVSLPARGKEVGRVGLVQPGRLVRLKEFARNWVIGGFGPLLHSRELKTKLQKLFKVKKRENKSIFPVHAGSSSFFLS